MGAETGELVRSVRARLAAAGIEGAALDARVLVGAALGADRTELVRRERETVTASALAGVETMVRRRLMREPVSRILGEREFWSLPFKVSPATLDPRADTETLVAACLEIAAKEGWRDRAIRLADLGTGSGCLAVALLSELELATAVCSDASLEALGVARHNARANGVAGRAAFVCGDWAAALAGPFDLVVSNPPYVPSGRIDALAPEVARFDPRSALDGGRDGLDCYRRIAREAAACVGTGGWLVLEVGAEQAGPVMRLVEDTGFTAHAQLPETVRDLAGVPRCVRVCRQGR